MDKRDSTYIFKVYGRVTFYLYFLNTYMYGVEIGHKIILNCNLKATHDLLLPL
jgi:hypothetical protein